MRPGGAWVGAVVGVAAGAAGRAAKALLERERDAADQGLRGDQAPGRAGLLELVLVLLLYFSVGVGVKAFVLSGRLPPLASPDQATPSLLLNATPIILAALVFSGIAAATMSAANSFINIGAAIVSHDLPVAFGRRVNDELRWGRAMTILIAVAAAITAQRRLPSF